MKDRLSRDNTSIGWIGTGIMGFWMCRHIIEKGYSVTVYNRTKNKAIELLEKGAIWVDSPSLVAENSDIVFTVVGFPRDVREVYFGEKGIFSTLKKGSIAVDMTTNEPSLAVEIYDKARAMGCYAVDAPVSGGDIGAREARLTIMAGGDRASFDYLKPIFEVMGKNILYQGRAGSGQHTKMCNQITIAGTVIGVCESLIYGHNAGLDLQTMLDTIRGGAAACWALENYVPRILKGDYSPGFMVDHFIKDMGIALEEARRMNLFLPGLSLVQQLYIALKSLGHGGSGTHALVLALDKVSGSSFSKRKN